MDVCKEIIEGPGTKEAVNASYYLVLLLAAGGTAVETGRKVTPLL